MKKIVGSIIVLLSSGVMASDGNNIKACVDAASSYANIKLDSFSAAYEPKRIVMSRVRWSNADCEVKLGYVQNLVIDGKRVIYDGYAGEEAFKKSKELKIINENAIQQLKSRIALLEQDIKDVDKKLKSPNPNLEQITVDVRKTVERALSR